jgi:hypothetical protein
MTYIKAFQNTRAHTLGIHYRRIFHEISF